MTVTMTIEEFDELREAKRTLDEVKNYLRRNVYYTKEADSCSCADAWQYAKALPHGDVAILVDLVGVWPKADNIDQPEEEKA